MSQLRTVHYLWEKMCNGLIHLRFRSQYSCNTEIPKVVGLSPGQAASFYHPVTGKVTVQLFMAFFCAVQYQLNI
jgi:hypothetical protein